MSDNVVYARDTLHVAWSEGESTLRKGQPWDADSTLVTERPDLFEEAPGKVAGQRQPRVERATRAPGERRGPQPGPRR